MAILRSIDPTIFHNAIGFERLLKELECAVSTNDNYPPYNLIRLGTTQYILEVAVAGFKENELDVEVNNNKLYVRGNKEVIPRSELNGVEYIHRGISTRHFVRTVTIGPDIVVNGASVTDGILRIEMEQVIPDDKKPKKIAIAFQK